MWGYLKQEVYQQIPFRNVGHLEWDIRLRYVRECYEFFVKERITCIEREGEYFEPVVTEGNVATYSYYVCVKNKRSVLIILLHIIN